MTLLPVLCTDSRASREGRGAPTLRLQVSTLIEQAMATAAVAATVNHDRVIRVRVISSSHFCAADPSTVGGIPMAHRVAPCADTAFSWEGDAGDAAASASATSGEGTAAIRLLWIALAFTPMSARRLTVAC